MDMKKVKALLTVERLVDVAQHVVTSQRLEEGEPLRWSNKGVAIPFLPHRDDCAPEASIGRAPLAASR